MTEADLAGQLADDAGPGAAPEVEHGDGRPSPAGYVTSAPPTSGFHGLWTLFMGLGLLMIGNGLNGAVIGVRSGTEGFSVTVTGLIMAGYFAGFLLAPTLVVRMLGSVGHIRVFAGLASVASSAVLVHAVAVLPATWLAMRFLFGFCAAGLYIVIESWLNALSEPSSRGRTLAVYMIVSMGGLGVGQFLIGFADPTGFELFVLSSVLVSLSLVPVTLAATTRAPVVALPDPMPVGELIRSVPTAALGSFVAGAGSGIVFGLSAVYATQVGFSVDRTAVFLLAPTLGAIVFQWPIGRLSDRVSRRGVIFGVAIGALLCSLAIAVLPADTSLAPLLMVGVGGTLFPLYSLVISYTLDWTPPERSMAVSGTLVRVNGAGALTGPLLTAPLMGALGASSVFWALSAAFGLLSIYVAGRVVVRDPLPLDRQTDFVPFPARATGVAFRLVRRPITRRRRADAPSIRSRRHGS